MEIIKKKYIIANQAKQLNFNLKFPQPARCPRPCFYNPYFATKLMQPNLETLETLRQIVCRLCVRISYETF